MEEARMFERVRTWRREPVLVADHELILTGGIAEPRDALAVW